MTAVSELDLPSFDYDDPSLRGARFHEVMRELREHGWLARTQLGYVVLDREAASFFLRTRSATFPGKRIAELFGIDEGPLHEEIERNILHIDGGDHRRLRSLVNAAFTPRAADRFRPAMRTYLAKCFDALDGEGECEFVSAFAKHYPAMVIATLMGAPLADAARLAEWSNVIQRQFDVRSLTDGRDAVERAVAEFYAYAEDLSRPAGPSPARI